MRHTRLYTGPWRWAYLAACCTALAGGGIAHAENTAAATGAEPRFDVEAYDVDGAKLLKQEEIETAVYPFLGPGRTRDDVEHARAALEKAYHDRGYQSVVVEVPAQSVSEAVIRLHVVEAPIGRLRVMGSRYFSPDFIKAQTPSLKEGEVANFKQTEAELADVNRLADRRVTPLLRAGEAPGTVDIDLKVTDTLPVHASVELNNDHNENTEPLRLITSVHYDNLWQLGHSASFTYSVAPQNSANSQVFAGSYLAPLWTTPWNVLVFGYDSNSNVASLGGTTVLGKGYSVGVRFIDQLPSLGGFAQSLSIGADFKHFDQDVVVKGAATTAPVTYAPLDASYTVQRERGQNSLKLTVSLTAGLGQLGSDTAEYQVVRSLARPEFIHFNVDISATQGLWLGAQGAEHLVGQIADGPLASSEQFSAGGLTSVRGYLQSEAIGDNGVNGSFELRSPHLESLAGRRIGRYIDDLRVFAFVDAAAVQVVAPLPAQTDFFDLYSTGAGVRFQLLKYLKGEADIGVPLTAGAVTRADKPRISFSVKSEF
jgi:hemolysin activation/secretion protein